jgi:hypothetical protein
MRSIQSPQIRLAGILGMLALFGAGCGGGGGHASTGAYVFLQWSLYDLDDTAYAKPLLCDDAGAGAIVLSDVQGTYSDTFNCKTANYEASGHTIPSGTYSLTATLYGDPAVYKNSTTVLDTIALPPQTLVNGANTVVADFLLNAYILNWQIVSGGVVTTCANVGASYVELDIYYAGQTTATAYYFNCASNRDSITGLYRDITSAIAIGSYPIQWQAFLQDASYRDLASTQLAPYNVLSGVQADLQTAYFDF